MTTYIFPPIVTGGMDTCRIRHRISGAESCFFCLEIPFYSTWISRQPHHGSFPISSKPYFPAFTVSGDENAKGPSRTFVSEPKSIRSGNSHRALAGRNFSNTQTGIAARIPAVSQTLLPKKTDYENASVHPNKHRQRRLYLHQQPPGLRHSAKEYRPNGYRD